MTAAEFQGPSFGLTRAGARARGRKRTWHFTHAAHAPAIADCSKRLVFVFEKEFVPPEGSVCAACQRSPLYQSWSTRVDN